MIDYQHNIAFTGDVYINMHGMTAQQAEYAFRLNTSIMIEQIRKERLK